MALTVGSSELAKQPKERCDFSLTDIVKLFNSPINEEQAWAVCYQCIQHFISDLTVDELCDFCEHGCSALRILRDGTVSFDSSAVGTLAMATGKKGKMASKDCPPKRKAVETLGMSLFEALDYGLKEHEERPLSPSLESLIELLTTGQYCENQDDNCQNTDDEGIEHDHGDEDEDFNKSEHTSLIVKLCVDRLSYTQNASQHYKAVCRALNAEALELVSFLDKMSTTDQKLTLCPGEELTIDELQRGDWARLWVQIMRELRHGVKLKKVEHDHMTPVEYELTPYEVLMEDIRYKRYNLNKIMVNGDIPGRVKNDAHDVILEFIRSRPPLTPVGDRILSQAPIKPLNAREKLLNEIRKKPQLKPVELSKPGRLMESSRTSLFDSDSDDEIDHPPIHIKTLIKPDISLLLSSSFEVEEEEKDMTFDTTDEEDLTRTRISPTPMSPLSPISPSRTINVNKAWREKGAEDLIANRSGKKLSRRHSITVCESPSKVQPARNNRWSWFKLRKMKEEQKTIDEHDSNCNLEESLESTDQENTSPSSLNTIRHSSSVNGDCSCAPRVDHPKTSSTSSGSGHVNSLLNLSQLNAAELMHVSWKSECPRKTNSQSTLPCVDCRPVPKKWQNPMECLSLRLDEVMHIREVLTKAELEGLSIKPQLYNQLSKLKLCFTCKTTRFTLFGEWGTKCRLCKRTVCSKCLRKMHIPTEHFEKIPVYALSPSPLTPENQDFITSLTGTGSKPPSPLSAKKLFSRQITHSKRPTLSRSHTITARPSQGENLNGPQMNVCCECKNMVCEIIRVSRTSVTLASHGNDWQTNKSAANRNLHLDLATV